MTRREIFLNADPYAVSDAIGIQDIEVCGKMTHHRIEEPFEVCKGLKWLAQRKRFGIDEQTAINKILNAYGKFKMTPLQATVEYRGNRATLMTALEALGLTNCPSPDERVQEWLDQPVMTDYGSDASAIAIRIISELLQNKENNRK